MADEIEDGKFSFPLRFPFVDPTKVGPAEVPFKFPREFGFQQAFKLFGRTFTDDLDKRKRTSFETSFHSIARTASSGFV